MTSTPAALPTTTGGDTDAARLYEKYGDQLYRFCLARLRSPEEAEDAVQSTFMRVHAALAKGTRPRFEAAWLYKIAQNVCLTRRMVTARRAEHESPGDPVVLEQLLHAPERSDELAGLPEALAAMPQNLRNAILLREWQGLSYAEIAERMGTTVGAVETLIFRARRHLAKALEPPARRPVLARLLDAGWLYGAARVLLARLGGLLEGVGAAKLAVGAAALALGGAGVGTALTVAASPVRPLAVTPAAAAGVAAAASRRVVAATTAAFPAVHRPHVVRRSRVRRARRAATPPTVAAAPAVPPAPAAAGAATPVAAPVAAAPAVPVPMLEPAPAATTSALPTVTAPPAVTTLPVATTLPTPPGEITLPAVTTTPVLPVATVTVPAVTTTSVAASTPPLGLTATTTLPALPALP